MQRELKLELKANIVLSRAVYAHVSAIYYKTPFTVERVLQATIRISSAIDFSYHTVIAIFPFQWAFA